MTSAGLRCETKGCQEKKAGERIRTADVQLGNIASDSITPLYSNSYKSDNRHLTANFTENFAKFQQDLARVIKRWPSLLPNIQAAIMVLIGGDDE